MLHILYGMVGMVTQLLSYAAAHSRVSSGIGEKDICIRPSGLLTCQNLLLCSDCCLARRSRGLQTCCCTAVVALLWYQTQCGTLLLTLWNCGLLDTDLQSALQASAVALDCSVLCCGPVAAVAVYRGYILHTHNASPGYCSLLTLTADWLQAAACSCSSHSFFQKYQITNQQFCGPMTLIDSHE